MPKYESEQQEQRESSTLAIVAKRTVASVALAGSIIGGVAACARILDDGVPNCGDKIMPDTRTTPNARIDIDGEFYSIDVLNHVGEPRLAITKGYYFHEFQANDPIIMELVPDGEAYVGSVIPEDATEELHISASKDLKTIDTECN